MGREVTSYPTLKKEDFEMGITKKQYLEECAKIKDKEKVEEKAKIVNKNKESK